MTSTSASNSSGGLSNRFQSYQQGTLTTSEAPQGSNTSNMYQPPAATYADQQTNVLQDATRTQYQAEGTANEVLTRMTEQRSQLTKAHDDVWDMRHATVKAKQEIQDLDAKYRAKKHKLYVYIALLGAADLFLFVRLLICGGGFVC